MMTPVILLTVLSAAQAQERFAIIRPALEEGVSQAQVARTRKLAPSTVQLWIKRYREKGLSGLANHVARSDKGKSRRLPTEAIRLIEGLALQTPPRSAASIHRQVSTIAKEQGWPPPSYHRVYTIIKKLDPALVTLAHQGAAAYREEFDLLYRREAAHANAMWQADHTPLDIVLVDEAGKPAKPWLTVIEDDYSRCIAGFRLSFQESTALTTALALREAPILDCRTVFYTPPVSASPGRIEREIMALCASFAYLVEAANQRHQGKDEFLVTRRFSQLVELLIVDEANRLKDVGLEQIRDLYDRGQFGLILLGMPGLEKRLARAPQLYSRIGFAHQIHPLAEEETRFFLEQRWSHRVKVHSEDFTDREAVAALLRITRGNIRLIERLMMQVEHILVANQLQVVTAEVVETARENLVIGMN